MGLLAHKGAKEAGDAETDDLRRIWDFLGHYYVPRDGSLDKNNMLTYVTIHATKYETAMFLLFLHQLSLVIKCQLSTAAHHGVQFFPYPWHGTRCFLFPISIPPFSFVENFSFSLFPPSPPSHTYLTNLICIMHVHTCCRTVLVSLPTRLGFWAVNQSPMPISLPSMLCPKAKLRSGGVYRRRPLSLAPHNRLQTLGRDPTTSTP